MTRKTGKDYRRELQDIKQQEKALEARIIARAKKLCKQCPDILVAKDARKIHDVVTGDYVKIDDLHVLTALCLIEMVEKHLADTQPHKQTSINF
jgi:hypothetical protein